MTSVRGAKEKAREGPEKQQAEEQAEIVFRI
jgi:hypothetical protein